jgi:multidrug resistance efflux pump
VSLRERLKENLVPQSIVDEAELKLETLTKSLPFYDERIGELQGELAKVDELLGRLKASSEQPAVIMQIFKDRIERMQLKSLAGGKVSNIFFRTGAVVRRGEPIVKILNTKHVSARGFIQEENADKVSQGMPVFISPTGEATAKIYPGKITYIAPQISSTPDIGSSVAGRMIKGREITCSFDDPNVELLPGQSVTIHLEEPGKFKLFSFGK